VDRITEIQQALAKDGSYAETPSGKWDDSTVAAMKKFQDAHGLNPSGKLDAKTLQQLGLGSSTAGAAAPMPPVGSSSAVSPSKPLASKQ
jgi:peptidoglycan hydrolase-like protein with peptidoglycan-binding domain